MSEQAQQWLVLKLPRPEYPALDDAAAWLSYVEQNDSFVRSQLSGVTVPVRTAKSQLGGFPTYTLCSAMPHGGFGGTSPEDQELSADTRRLLDSHRR